MQVVAGDLASDNCIGVVDIMDKRLQIHLAVDIGKKSRGCLLFLQFFFVTEEKSWNSTNIIPGFVERVFIPGNNRAIFTQEIAVTIYPRLHDVLNGLFVEVVVEV